MIDPSEVTAARYALGRLLAKYREAAGLKQHQLAPHTNYCRSTIGNVETGRQHVPRAFWERCEQALSADGALLAAADQLEDLIQRQREETTQLADIQRERQQRQPEVRQVAELAAQYAESAALLHEDAGDLPKARYWTEQAIEWRNEAQDPSMPPPTDGPMSASMMAPVHAEVAASEWPAWFGIRLADLIGVVDNWPGPGVQSEALQALLHQEIQMYDALAPKDQGLAHALSRRQALITLAALPLSLASGGGPLSPAATTELFLARCAASLAACWHLLKGSDLYTIEQVLVPYLLKLKGLAQRRSVHQKTAARLASQAHRICGIVALHRDKIEIRKFHCRQALDYSLLTSDISSRVSALISLASTYFYDANPTVAAATYEQALNLEPDMSPLHRSRVHAELSVVYGQLGCEQDALRSVGFAEQIYPAHPEQDRSYLYAEFTQASLTLEQGLSYAALAEGHPGHDYQHKAADIFARMEQAPPASVPDRIRFEIINHQARTAVLLNDLDAFENYLSCSVDGIVQLGSKQRQKEMYTAWQRAVEQWPNEPRLKALGGRIRSALSQAAVRTEGGRA